MKTFLLPDLAEGLVDAELREWYVKEGDEVQADDPIVAMETAKALVDVPSPYSGKILKLHGEAGDTIKVGAPLISYDLEDDASDTNEPASTEAKAKDAGTVVGSIEESENVLNESATGVAVPTSASGATQCLPGVRLMAKQMGINIDELTPSNGSTVTIADVLSAANLTTPQNNNTAASIPDDSNLTGMQKAMVLSMTQSHNEVVPVTLFDEADIRQWKKGSRVMQRIIRAIVKACEAEPILNSHYFTANWKLDTFEHINLGVAVDTEHGLYVPVIKDAAQKSESEWQNSIDQFKQQASTKSIPQADLKDATISLSNFGSLAGRFGTPIITPPMVAIIGIGRLYENVVPYEGSVATHKMLPLSLTVDHRVITGGQAARFLAAMIEDLS